MAPCPPEDRETVLVALEHRFGIPRDLLGDRSFFRAADDRVFVGPDEVPGDVDPVVGGLCVARLQARVKPTTDFLQAFGDHVSRSVVDVDRDQARAFVAGEDVPRSDLDADVSRGWVAVRYGGHVMGCGFWNEEVLESVVPKGRRVDLEAL